MLLPFLRFLLLNESRPTASTEQIASGFCGNNVKYDARLTARQSTCVQKSL